MGGREGRGRMVMGYLKQAKNGTGSKQNIFLIFFSGLSHQVGHGKGGCLGRWMQNVNNEWTF